MKDFLAVTNFQGKTQFFALNNELSIKNRKRNKKTKIKKEKNQVRTSANLVLTVVSPSSPPTYMLRGNLLVGIKFLASLT